MLRFNFGTLADNVLGVIFQYILCYGSTAILEQLKKGNSCISIHPMLRFNLYTSTMYKNMHNISIYPMLRFNRICHIRIVRLSKFQYILCYGSTSDYARLENNKKNFNTSYVTVQQPILFIIS